jgi:glycosyltransferase involved in cell wall biosynthesis
MQTHTVSRCPTLQELPSPAAGLTGWPWTEDRPQLSDSMPDGRAWPKISIVTPSFNQGAFLEETIRSVLLQGYANLEYIIIDGGSSDNSPQIIEKYAKWIYYWRSEPDAGQSHAINKGFDQSSGKIKGYLNSDDLLLPGALHKVAQAVEPYEHSPIILMGDCEMGVKLDTVWRKWCPDPPTSFLDAVSREGICPQPATFWTQPPGVRPRRFNEQLDFCMDYEFWCQLVSDGYKPVKLDACLAFYRHHEEAKGNKLTGLMWSELAGIPLLESERVSSFDEKLSLAALSRRRFRHYLRIEIERAYVDYGKKAALRTLVKACQHDPGFLLQRPTLGLARQLLFA